MMHSILLVESEPAIHQVVRMVLEERGYAVCSAYTAAQAAAQLDRQRPAAVLANLILPDQNGLDLCRSIRDREECVALPILLLSGRCRRGDADRARMAGATTLLTLPFDDRAVLGWLDAVQVAAEPPATAGSIASGALPSAAS